VKDILVGNDGLDGFKISMGNQKQPYSLVVEESSNDLSFIERGIDSFLVNAFADRAIGVRLEGTGDHFFVAGGVFGGAVSSDTTTDGWGVAGRAVWAPIQSDDSVLHLGFRTLYRQPSYDDKSVEIKDETTHHSSLSVVDTGNLLSKDFKDITMFGPEVAFTWRFAALKAEYNYGYTRRLMNPAVGLQSGHVSLSLGLTGQSWADAYKMSAGEFRRLKNVHDFDPRNGHWGGLELASRWSFLDLSDGTVTGGYEQAVSTDLIWQLNYNVRMMFDWTHIVKTKGPAWNDPVNETAQGLNTITVRAQFAF
jgi:phosphate-selective porin OprO/OprP